MALQAAPQSKRVPEPDCWCKTDHQVTFSYQWTICNFKVYLDLGQQYNSCWEGVVARSPAFSSGLPDDKLMWQLSVVPAGREQDSKTVAHITLLSGTKSVVFTGCRCYILDSNQEKWTDNPSGTQMTFNRHQLGKDEKAYAVKNSDLLEPSNGLLPEGNLTLNWEILVYRIDEPRVTTATKHYPDIVKGDIGLTRDLGLMFKDSLFTDVTIVAGAEEFKAHKSVLSARSQVFRAMFEHDMKEGIQNQVTIEDLESKVAEEMFTFIYTGNAPNLVDMTESLFSVADMYALEELKLLCERELAKRLSIENAVETLVLADQHSAVNLRGVCIDFLAANAQEVMDSPGWSKLVQHHGMMMEVIRKAVANPSVATGNTT